MRALSMFVPALALATLAACGGPKPPSRWAMGGARVDLPMATGILDDEPISIEPKGTWAEVLVDGEVELVVDAVGRVYDRNKRPIGMLESDGRVAGRDDALLGLVGSVHAAPPWQASAWLSVLPDGRVVAAAVAAMAPGAVVAVATAGVAVTVKVWNVVNRNRSSTVNPMKIRSACPLCGSACAVPTKFRKSSNAARSC